ncbi:MAG: aminotransferase class IV [Alistipes sp.]|nr:aminotransferase class IV [Alistipes sp.]
MILNGELREWRPSQTPYVYQQIHTLAYKARHTADHLKILGECASRLFALQCDLTRREVEQQIEQLLTANRSTRQTSICVTIKLYASGDYSLEESATSIYSGYVLRSLRPEATFISSSAPLGGYPTSAMESTREMMREVAAARDLHHLIMVTPAGEVVIDSAEPLFIVNGYTLTLPQVAMPSVEQMLIEQAAHSLGFKFERKPLTIQMLKDADEVLTASWQGISAIAHIDSKPYMAIIAERLAREIENKEKR